MVGCYILAMMSELAERPGVRMGTRILGWVAAIVALLGSVAMVLMIIDGILS